jgi:membrane-associated protein
MEWIKWGLDILIHLDKHLDTIIQHYGVWTHLLLCLVIFCETGLVATPFLPGDSLLFAAGTFAALGSLDLHWLVISLPLAAILGDTTNYWIGRVAGPRVFSSKKSRLLNQNHLRKTHDFYQKHGAKTIIIARFIPIIRTFAPFVAGIGKMPYGRFIAYSVTGGICWIMLFSLGGYFFGNLPVVRNNFFIVIIIIIVISVLPAVIEVVRQRAHKAVGPVG